MVYDSVVLQSETFDACVLSDSYPALNAGLVRTLHSRGVKVIGVCEDSENARSFLASVGVDAVVASHLSAATITTHISDFLSSEVKTVAQNSQEIDVSFENEFDAEPEQMQSGQACAFIGAGGTGATEVALVTTSRLIDALIIDTDFEHPSLAARTNSPIEPHILDAIESAQNHPANFADCVQRMSSHSLIVGTSHASFSRDIRPDEIHTLLATSRNAYTNVVCDLGRVSEDSGFASITSSILDSMDTVFIIGESTPVGILRILESVAYVHSQTADSNMRIGVIVNKCRKNKDVINQVRRELESIDQIDFLTFLSFEKDLELLSWKGKTSCPTSWNKSIESVTAFIGQKIETIHAAHDDTDIDDCIEVYA